jgi:mRNA-degrading endonuclease RelE of RelBE toxin-antitoxin system
MRVWGKLIEARVSKAFLNGFGQDSFRPKKSDRAFVFKEIPKLNSLGASGKIESMKGYRSCYKARFGSYRIGMSLKTDTLTLE